MYINVINGFVINQLNNLLELSQPKISSSTEDISLLISRNRKSFPLALCRMLMSVKSHEAEEIAP